MFFLPSRGRPKSVQRLADAYRISEAKLPVMLLLDSNDDFNYAGLRMPPTWIVYIQRQMSMCEKIASAMAVLDDAEFYGFLGDDAFPLTPHWDTITVEAAGDWNVVGSADGIQDEKLSVHPVAGRKLVEALGWFALPGVKHLYFDTALTELAKALGRFVYLPDVQIEHLHHSVGKSEYDETYKLHAEYGQHDKEVFEHWQQNGLAEDLNKVRQAMIKED